MLVVMKCSIFGKFSGFFTIFMIMLGILFTYYLFVLDSSLKMVGICILISSILKYLVPAESIYCFLKSKDYPSFELKLLICGFICYGGWFLFGLNIGDIYCIISNGLLTLAWMIAIPFDCWLKCNKKKANKEDKTKVEQIEVSEVQSIKKDKLNEK